MLKNKFFFLKKPNSLWSSQKLYKGCLQLAMAIATQLFCMAFKLYTVNNVFSPFSKATQGDVFRCRNWMREKNERA